MDFRLTEDQEALQSGIRSWCDGQLPLETLAEIAKNGGFDAKLWSGLAEMGAFGLRLPESDGGVGLGMAEAVLVFGELGRALAPGPVVWTHLAADLVPGAASGETVVGGVDLAGAFADPILVEHPAALDVLLALYADRVERVDAKSLATEPIATPLDPLTPIAHARTLPEGERIGGADLAARLRLEGAALTAALSLGVAERSQELATAYAKEREQFGRAVAGFQSIKHMLADMWVRQEMARAAVWSAGATIDQEGVGDPARAVASAKVVAGDAAMKNARASIQIHGGMGYVWEMAPHYYLKRAWVLATSFGGSEEYEEQLARQLG
ncbi:MAG: acyl-CoA/acyl-ACP dehydrogenase [Myxococcota bacterium]|jgi:alkylation response protein AidB-like acyl-CoA dehydrogenase|nr:acyl-CoA/acyl-ACP dehydrogenase [Myxococcota bacterium]